MRLKRDPDYWELRGYAGEIHHRATEVRESLVPGRQARAGKALTQFVAEIDVKGTQADLSVAAYSPRTSTISSNVAEGRARSRATEASLEV